MNWENKQVLVFGAGVSGIGSAQLLLKVGALPVIYDANTRLTQEDVIKRLGSNQAQIVIGELSDEVLDSVAAAVLSPGVPTDLPVVIRIREKNIPVIGEIELAYSCSKGDVLAITGTNGKTTTTTLVGEIMKYHCECKTAPHNDRTFVVGNIGTPYTQAALDTTPASVTVAEISSFQLETIRTFHPAVSAITNITPDHLDRHHTMEEYIRVKERITENQTPEDTCVLNYEDEVLRAFGGKLHTRVIFFSSARQLQDGLYYDEADQCIKLAKDGVSEKLVSVKEVALPGLHNYENIMTAIGITYAYNVPMEEIVHVVKRFTAVEHRIEYVATKGGVMYYNDSKGTNPDAAIKGIEAMDRPTVLLAGGYDKGSFYGDWIRSFNGKVRHLVLTGQTKDKIREEALNCGFTDVTLADTFEEAFSLCVKYAQPGDAVLLSPACASWGMFLNYEVRGKVFKDLVSRLE